MWTRAGDRSILVNDPDGFPSATPVIPQPAVGFANPGYTWLGSDNPGWFRPQPAGLPSVSRALGLIADSIASMPWAVYRGRDRVAEPRWVADPMNAQKDRRANWSRTWDPMAAVAWRSQMLASLVMHGEAFLWAPYRDEAGYPLAPVEILDPLWVEGGVSTGGRFHMTSAGDRIDFAPESLLHVLGRAPYTVEGRGQGVLARHSGALELAATVRSAVGSAYGSGVPNGYLKVNNPGLTQDQATGLKSAWMAAHGGPRGIAVLNATTEFHPISWSLADLSAIEMGSFTDRDIAHAFGMSAHWLDVVGDSNTYANVQDEAISFRTFTLLPWARLVESALETWLPVGTTMKIRMEGLERANVTTRDDSYVKRLTNGIMTVDEVREIEDMGTLAEGFASPSPTPQEATQE